MPGPAIDSVAVEAYLHAHIPISAAMGISVVRATLDEVALAAPLEPNVNHRSTVFGGSAASVAILAAWTLVHLRVVDAGVPARVVIQHGETDYLRPIRGRFTATCRRDDPGAWDAFRRTLERRGRARIALAVSVEGDGEAVAAFRGTYVAIAGAGEEGSGDLRAGGDPPAPAV
jgi:thioesterase domain-containing protein